MTLEPVQLETAPGLWQTMVLGKCKEGGPPRKGPEALGTARALARGRGGGPDHPPKRARGSQGNEQPTPEPKPMGRNILTAFDGIGAGPYLIEQRFGQPRLALAWEIDQDCLKVTAAKLPWLAHRGDITKDDPKKVAATIREADPNKECLVLFEAAPPCQDFSRLGPGRATKAQGDASSPSPPTSCRRYLTTSRATTPPPSSRTSS